MHAGPSISCSFLPCPTFLICFPDIPEAFGADLPLSWSNRLLPGIGGYREISTVLFLQLLFFHQETERIVNENLAPRDAPGQENIADLLGRGAGNPTRFDNRSHKIC